MKVNDKIELIGLYSVPDDENVFLIELLLDETPTNVDVSLFVLKNPGIPESDWQTAYDEQYLNNDGTVVIGDYYNRAQLSTSKTRIVFYMYIENLPIQLSTPYGSIDLIKSTEIPDRLRRIIAFDPMD